MTYLPHRKFVYDTRIDKSKSIQEGEKMTEIPESEEMQLACASCCQSKAKFRRVIYTEKILPNRSIDPSPHIGGPPRPPLLPFAKHHALPFAYCLECSALKYIGPEPEEVVEEIEQERKEIENRPISRRC